MKVKMIKTMDGSPDGIQVNTYVEDETYDLPEDLAKVFIDNKWGAKVRKKQAPENKAVEKAPENKAGKKDKPKK